MVVATHSEWLTGSERKKMYSVWSDMFSRCQNPNNKSFSRYGAKGIDVCDRWQFFENFLADMGQRPDGFTIDRINGSLGYSPENCRWASAHDQSRNKSNNKVLDFEGKSMIVNDWAVFLGVPRTLIRDRLKMGWSVEKTLTTPHTKKPRIIKGESQ